MKNISRISKFLAAYLAWILFILLFLVIILLGRDTLLAFLRNYWAAHSFSRKYAIDFIDRIFVLVIGIAWLILMLIIESYFRNGVKKNILPHRLSLVFGTTISAIFVIHFLRTLMIGFTTQTLNTWSLLLLELVVSMGLLFISRKTTKTIKLEKIE
jgi:hypothetical protein